MILDKSAAPVRRMISRAERRLNLGRHISRIGTRQVIDRLVDAIRSGDQNSTLRLLLADDATIGIVKDGDLRILAIEVDDAGHVAGLQQVNNPDKLERVRSEHAP
ncbi:sigma-70 family RNA polymerase sigma factor family protein [Brevibacterium siliguriense]|uniref:hypothetical protein n=1 Tax=Brevibacterium siliguriense TaxID=1136497 RepID=UPI000B83AFDF|nr:hypothetical protein [Brevibacterium siliguriense]